MKLLKTSKELIGFIFSFMGNLRPMFWVTVTLFAVQVCWEFAVLFSVGSFFKGILGGDNNGIQNGIMDVAFRYFHQIPKEERPLWGFIFISASLLGKEILDFLVDVYRTKFATLYINKVRFEIFDLVLRCRLSYFDGIQKGHLMQIVIHETRACYNLLKVFLDFLGSGAMIATYLVILGLVSVKLTLIVLVFSALVALKIYATSDLVKKHASIYTDCYRKVTAIVDEMLSGVKQVKLLGAKKSMLHEFGEVSNEADFASRKYLLIIQIQNISTQVLGIFSFLLILFINYRFKFLELSALLAFFYAIKELMRSISNLNQRVSLLKSNMPSITSLMKFIESSKSLIESSGTRIPDSLSANIRLNGVSLSYGGEDVLKDLTLEVRKGESVAFVGESGAGKTSIINLIPRLYELRKGEIRIGDIQLNEFDLDELRKKVAIVNQDNFLFNKSVLENILLARPEASKEEVVEASKKANAHDFILELPQGYDTIVGDRGVKLSGGQKQRLTIAQAFLKNADIIIFDEATSALDSKSESFIQTSIEALRGKKTCLVIAHRLSTIKNVDKIVVLEKGRIIETGSWEDLSNRGGKFAEMLQHQLV